MSFAVPACLRHWPVAAALSLLLVSPVSLAQRVSARDRAAAEALESYVGIFTGGEEPVTLTASRFGSADAAAANAQAAATALGTPTDSGVVYPDENRDQYWIFNNDGLITIVWTDGDLGSYEIVSESAEAALDFYNGLSF